MHARHSRLIGILVCALALAALSCGKEPGFERVPDAKVDARQRLLAEDFAKAYFGRMREGRFEPLGDEATAEMRSALTPERQKESYESLVKTIGGFESLAYAETWRGNANGNTIFRFRARFGTQEPEVRVVLDPAGKVGGFWVKPWKDGLE
ncbi:MAG: hypothetical protein PHU25_20180 [Deltaproteobacteria bacterium]|nr:hypothetical protein [Deltaproteobacteria bacterium]